MYPNIIDVFGTTTHRLGLGLLRLCTEGRIEESEAIRVIHFALDHGVRLLDTADSYCLDNSDFHYGETLACKAIDSWSGDRDSVRIFTKVGLVRPQGKWIPNGSAKHIRKSVETALKCLDVEQIYLLQLHAKDNRVPFDETLEALATLQSEGKVAHLGLCNVGPAEVRQAQQHFPVAALQCELSLLSRKSATDGLLLLANELGIPFLAHRPLGGYAKVEKLTTNRILKPIAERYQRSPHEIALAALLQADARIIPLIGATKCSSVASSIGALSLPLDVSDKTVIDIKYSFTPDPDAVASILPQAIPTTLRTLEPNAGPSDLPEVVIVMGIQGAGKTELVGSYTKHGYARLNRDELGGKLEDLNVRLATLLASGSTRVVLDNTYPTRVSRAGVVRVAHQAGIPVRCCWIDTPIHEARRNVVLRTLARYERLLGPGDMKELAKVDPNLPPPPAMQKWIDTLEAPNSDEGFSAIDRIPFVRKHAPLATNKGLLLDVDGTLRVTKSGEIYPRSASDVSLLPNRKEVLSRWIEDGYQLFFVSNQSGVASGKLTLMDAQMAFLRTAELLELPITEIAFCPHPAFPVGCFCRKPMPGLGVYLARKYQLNYDELIMVGDMDSDRQFADGLGIQYKDANAFFA